ncbi:MAG: hypothetical protein PHO83_06275 [Geobacteraceae bacterium]|nr:hypothetical protein [Geobacteraceae bacterium]
MKYQNVKNRLLFSVFRDTYIPSVFFGKYLVNPDAGTDTNREVRRLPAFSFALCRRMKAPLKKMIAVAKRTTVYQYRESSSWFAWF